MPPACTPTSFTTKGALLRTLVLRQQRSPREFLNDGGRLSVSVQVRSAWYEALVLLGSHSIAFTQLAVFFSAPPHDVLSSRFSFDLVSSDSDACCPLLGSVWVAAHARRERVPAAPNRVHFFSLKGEAPPGGAHRDAWTERCARGVCWVQLVVER